MSTLQEPPIYMEKGSSGPFVNAVLLVLKLRSQFFLGSTPKEEIQLDGEYGPVGIAHMKAFQRTYGLQADGGFGPETRKAFQQFLNIHMSDLIALAGEGPTIFVQPEDRKIEWSKAS